MLTTLQYRSMPTRKQKAQLTYMLRVCQYFYNRQLGERFDWYQFNRDSVITAGLWLSDHLENVKLREKRIKEAEKRAKGETVKQPLKPRVFHEAVDAPFCLLSCSVIPHELKDKPNKYSQKKQLPSLKKDLVFVKSSGKLLDFKRVPSQTLQDVSLRADKAFDRFLSGDKNGKKSGQPRFKNSQRYRTLKIEGQAISVERIGDNFLFLKITKLDGWWKIRLHRPLPEGSVIKNALVTKKADGWYISLVVEDTTVPTFNPDETTPTWENAIGLDAVLHEDDYLASSEGIKYPSLKSYRKNQEKLQTLQKKQSEAKKGSSARRKLAKKVSKLHQQIANSRKDHAYNTATQLVETGAKAFYIEKLNLQGLSKRNKAKKGEKLNEYLPNGQSAKSGLNKSWSDAAFGQFFTILEYKAAKAGAIVVKVNPAYTSQLLSYRDEIVFTDCSIREYYDEIERLIVDRDINAGINIKRVGLGLFPTIKRRSAKAKDATQSGVKITKSSTESSAKQVLETLKNVLEANTQSSGVA